MVEAMQDADAGIPLNNHLCHKENKTYKICFTGENPENEFKFTITICLKLTEVIKMYILPITSIHYLENK